MFGFGGGYGYGGYGGGYGGFDDDTVDRSHFRDKSDAAEAREVAAKKTFSAALLKREMNGEKTLWLENLIKPSVHLTDACWKDFRKFVVSHGCSCKRVEATAEEKKKCGAKRKGKCFFISVKMTAEAQVAAIAKAPAGTKTATLVPFAPTKPDSAYKMYCDAHRASTKARLPRGTTAAQVTAALKAAWAKCDTSPYEDKAAAASATYAIALDAYQSGNLPSASSSSSAAAAATPQTAKKRGAPEAAEEAPEANKKPRAAVGYPDAEAAGDWFPGRVTSLAKDGLSVAVAFDDGGVDDNVPYAHVEWTLDGVVVGARVTAWWPEEEVVG